MKISDDKPVLCENYFKKLKTEDPDTLKFYIVESGMGVGLTCIALPYLGETKNTKYWITITDCLRNKSPIVREGALEALWHFADIWKEETLATFKQVAEEDENNIIRQIAEDYYLELTENYDFYFGGNQ
jgi:hypothetical protein